MATVTSKEEDDWIKNNGLLGSDKYGVFLGASDAEVEGTWKWITGEPFTYTNCGVVDNLMITQLAKITCITGRVPF